MLTSGQRLGPYEVGSRLGAGGMGEVYQARDTRLGRDVALKVLPSAVASDPDRGARFEREAKAVAALSHPNILAIFEFAIHDGVPCAVTELLEGESLRTRLAHGALPVRRAIEIAVQIARGLSAAHDKGIVHRDLKPENIFLTHDGQVRILDFGLAKVAEGHPANTETMAGTDPGTVMGTAGYMAPEQVRGQAADARADLFALGAIIYEMLSGRRAFARDTAAETMSAILKEDPPDLATDRTDLPAALEPIVRHCLERNPAERFQSARDLAFNLQAITHPSGFGPASVVAPRRRAGVTWREGLAWALATVFAAGAAAQYVRAPALAPSSGVRVHVTAPERTTWAAPLGAPEGSNSGTISPDGTMLAFAAVDADGKNLLWVRPLDSFTARPLAGTEGAAFPFWSPDSRALAFFTATKLKKVAADGGPVLTLCDVASVPRGASWNNRGEVIFATSGGSIRRVSSDGGQPAPVAGPDSEGKGAQWPSFLPDGSHFFYYSSAARAVFVASLDASPPKLVVSADSNAAFAPPDQMLFVRDGVLLAQRFDAIRLEASGDARPLAERIAWSVAPWNFAAFSVSRTGILTYRLGGGSRTQFAWLDRAGRMIGTVGPPGDYLSPALSPDETRLAFTRRDDQPAGDIWTLDLTRETPPLRFTFSTDTDHYPVWMPDGSTLIYSSVREGLLAKPLTGTAAARQMFKPTTSLMIPTQAAAERVVFFGDMAGATGFDIFTLPLAGGATPTAVIEGTLTDAEPQLSPNGRWLAYATTETGNYEVFVQPLPATGAKWQVSSGGGRQPMWRADGGELYFVTNDRKFYSVEIRPGAAFEFGRPQFLFEMPANTISVRNSYVPSKDGKRFLVNRLLDTTVSPINVVMNWAAPPR